MVHIGQPRNNCEQLSDYALFIRQECMVTFQSGAISSEDMEMLDIIKGREPSEKVSTS